MKPKLCKSCKLVFIPTKRLQVCCSWQCGVEWGRLKEAKKIAKEEREDTKKRKADLKTKQELQRECQTAFNAWVRSRDRDLPCISCGRFHDGQWHAGHYISTGARPVLRFDEFNCHKQCQPCNTHLHGNLVNYRRALIAKIGLAEVERLESDYSTKNYTRDDLIQMAKDYRRKAKELK